MKKSVVVSAISNDSNRAVSRNLYPPSYSESIKSPLRYPGGKSRAVATIRKYIPSNIKILCAPFLGGASVELACAADGVKVYGADAFEPVINFWKYAKWNSELLSEHVRKYHPLTKQKFYSLQQDFKNVHDDFERAAIFYVLNRSSFSGTTLSGGMSPGHPRFNESAINRLRIFKASNLFVQCADYKDTLHKHNDKFLYLDPPYANDEKLYGNKGDMHKGFNHEELADELKRRDGWLLSYNDNELIRNLYNNYKIITPKWNYGMSGDKKSRELLILNAW